MKLQDFFINKKLGKSFKIPFKPTGVSWESYWSHQSEVLFFGLYSEISGGQMPNKVTGATDFLTVGGVAGSYTFQAPNTAAYIAADTDYIWFKTDASQRTTTEAELIGYDLQRTPVKYLDNAPNSIEAIMILSSAIEGDKLNKLFRDLHLPLLWNGVVNGSGYIKSNRLGQNLWTPEIVHQAEVLTYISGLTTPLSDAQLGRLDTLVGSLKTGLGIINLSDYFDVLFLFAGETSESSLRNLVKNAHHGTLGGTSPSFSQFEGFVSAGSTGYINSNYNPFTEEAVNYKLSDAAGGAYTRNDVVAGSSKTIFGNGTNSRMLLRYTGDLIRGSLNGGSISSLLGNAATSGLAVLRRAGNNIGVSKNGGAFETTANNATAIPNANFYILGYNNEGTFTGGTDSQISFCFFSKSVSDEDVLVIKNAIEAYMDSNEKGVII
jgi:hypothetical protein